MNNKMKEVAKILLVLCFCFALPVHATQYTPLVQIPGLGNSVTISSYLIGIYNFLLSIVGIVAVLMLILGGMRYISAAGNSSAIGDAKSMIESALAGLLLALLSWLIVSTINPDILYLKNPDMSPKAIGLFQCGTYDSISKSCTCLDNTATNTLVSVDDCQSFCASGNHCSDSGLFGSCIQPFSDNETTRGFKGPCTCITGNTVEWSGGVCDDLCESLGECGAGRFLVVKLRLRNAMAKNSDEYLISSSSTIESILDGKWTSHDPDAIWDFFLTDNGNYGPFAITALHSMEEGGENFDCAILTLNEDSEIIEGLIGGAAFDEGRIYWVKEGTVISSSNNNLLKSIDQARNYTSCCTTTNIDAHDCLMEAWGECESREADKVIRAVFSRDIVDEYANQVDLATTDDGGSVDYMLNRSLICSGGKWR